jgi:phage-related protein
VQELLLNSGGLRNEFFKTNGTVKSLRGVQDALAKSTGDLTKEQQLSTFSLLFGSDSMRAAAILANNGAKGYDKFSKSVAKTKAADVAKTRLDNLAGATQQFKGSLETIAITIGAVFLPMVTKVVNAATAVLNAFLSLPHGVQVAIAIFGLLLSSGTLLIGLFLAFLPVIAGFIVHMLAMRAIGTLVSGFRAFFTTLRAGQGIMAATQVSMVTTGTEMKALSLRTLFAGRMMIGFGKAMLFVGKALKIAFLNPYTLALLALVAVGILLYKHFKPFHDLVDKIAAILRDKLAKAWAVLQPYVQAAVDALKRFGDFVKSTVIPAALAIGKAFATAAIAKLKEFAKFVISTLLPVLKDVGQHLVGKIVDGWHQISDAIAKQLMPAIHDLATAWNTNGKPMFNSIIGFVGPIARAFLSFATAVGKFLLPVLQKMGEIFIKYVLPILIRVVGFLLGQVIGAVVLLVTGIIQAITGVIQIFTGLMRFFDDLFHGRWSKLWGDVLTIFKGVWNLIVGALKIYIAVGILKVVGLAFRGLLGLVRGGWGSILAIFRGAGRLILGLVRLAWRLVVAIIKLELRLAFAIIRGVFTAIPRLIKGALGLAVRLIKGGWSEAVSLTKSSWARLVDSIRTAIGKVGDFLKGLPGKIKGWIGDLSHVLFDAGAKLIQGLIDGITSKIKAVGDAVGNIAGKVKGFMPGSPIKEGPLVTWNDGGAGKRLVGLLADGLGDTKPVDNAIRSLAAYVNRQALELRPVVAAQPIGLAPEDRANTRRAVATTHPTVATVRQPPKGGDGPSTGRSRLVEGKLRIDEDGTAFIEGIAQDVVDDNDNFKNNRKRQRGGRPSNTP